MHAGGGGVMCLPCYFDLLRFAGGAAAQEVCSRGFDCVRGLKHLGCVFKALGCEHAQANALHVEHIEILERVLL